MGLQMGGVDHHSRVLTVLGGQTRHHLGEDALIAPSVPTVAECLVGVILPWGVAPPQTVAINQDNATQNTSIINSGLAMRLRKVRL